MRNQTLLKIVIMIIIIIIIIITDMIMIMIMIMISIKNNFMILINPRVIQNWSPLMGPCSESKLSQLSSDLSLMQTSRSVKKALNTSINAGI